jgi:23S rRNA pseudouridine1911/1915/1917 synthase
VKHPIVGDPIYGQAEQDVLRYVDKEITPEERLKLSGSIRLLLHANRLEFTYDGHDYAIVSKTDFVKDAFEAMGK